MEAATGRALESQMSRGNQEASIADVMRPGMMILPPNLNVIKGHKAGPREGTLHLIYLFMFVHILCSPYIPK